jgi:hypothetical protein
MILWFRFRLLNLYFINYISPFRYNTRAGFDNMYVYPSLYSSPRFQGTNCLFFLMHLDPNNLNLRPDKKSFRDKISLFWSSKVIKIKINFFEQYPSGAK